MMSCRTPLIASIPISVFKDTDAPTSPYTWILARTPVRQTKGKSRRDSEDGEDRVVSRDAEVRT